MSDSRKAPRLDLNPSSADRWTTCTASPQFILDNHDKLPPHDTAFNREGTTAHEVAAAFLQNREPRIDDNYCCPAPVDAEMRWHGWNYMEYVAGLATPSSRTLVEQKLPLWYMPARNAIVDVAVIGEQLHIVDYKYGAGIVVSPERSLQATIYAKAVLQRIHDISDQNFPITVHIYQPRGRAANDGIPFHKWETTLGEIDEIAAGVSLAAKSVLSETDLVFAPSEKACQWCPAKGFCEARREKLTGSIEHLQVIESGPKSLPSAKVITPEQLAAIVEHGDQIINWVKGVNAYALDFVKGGGKLPGFKLVLSRGGYRYWTNLVLAGKELAKTILREDEIWEKKLISPAGVEALLGKNKMNVNLTNLVGRPEGKPILAPIEDKRPEYNVDPTKEFDVITDNVDF